MNQQQNAISLARVSASSLVGGSQAWNLAKHRISLKRFLKMKIFSNLLVCFVIIGCSNDQSQNPNHQQQSPSFDIIALAGITTKTIFVAKIDSETQELQDTVIQQYRIPRSQHEFNAQIDSGIWAESLGSDGKKTYNGLHFVNVANKYNAKCWTPFFHDTITYSQTNGFPDELAFAINPHGATNFDIEYRVNFSGWFKLIRGRDYGVIGTDSIGFLPEIGSPNLNSNFQLVGVNLKIQGKNFLLEGNNDVSIRISQNGVEQAKKIITLKYIILGMSVYETDSIGLPVDTSKRIFYRDVAWVNQYQKQAFVFLGTRAQLDSFDVRINRSFNESISDVGIDSSLYKLPMIITNNSLIGDGWRVHQTPSGAIVEIRISKSLFIESSILTQNVRNIIINGKMIVTPGFPPNNAPFKVVLPIHL